MVSIQGADRKHISAVVRGEPIRPSSSELGGLFDDARVQLFENAGCFS
jgi:hypothetical protein